MSERRLPDEAAARTSDAPAEELERARNDLADVLGDANSSPSDAVAQVRLDDALCEFVPLLQKHGFDAERALLEFETLIARVERTNDERFGREAIVRCAISFSIDQYYYGGAGKEWR
jgi:hypothetical protein